MLRSAALALTAAALLALALGLAWNTWRSDGPARFVGSFEWTRADPDFGGWSGLEISSDGTYLTVISDRGHWIAARVERTGDAISSLSTEPVRPILDTRAEPVDRPFMDAEGLAIAPDGRSLISFEGFHRVLAYASMGAVATSMPRPEAFKAVQPNSGLEALAIDTRGWLYALPERSGAMTRPFPLYRFRDGAWEVAGHVPRRGQFLPVGADFGPDGLFYLLERDFAGMGFRSRVRRFDLSQGEPSGEELVLLTPMGRHDNLEGIAVWRDEAGRIRLTMIADNNFVPVQRTEIVEYALDPALQ